MPKKRLEGNGSVWFGDLTHNARRSKSAKSTKSNGDPGAICWAASLPCACEAPLRRERATPSFGGCSGNPVTYGYC